MPSTKVIRLNEGIRLVLVARMLVTPSVLDVLHTSGSTFKICVLY